MPSESTTKTIPGGSLADFTRRELIVLPLRERDAAGIIGELSRVLREQDCVPDVLPFYQAALNQELLANSANGFGIAVAHARLGGVKHLQFALGHAAQPVAWGAKGSGPVQLVFLLAVPATDAASYLHLLSSLARLGRNDEIFTELLAASDASRVLAVLGKIKLQ
jgi:mannitol/fructose-specific phosphotransferase system IIA component (Ntr-type)